MMYATVDGYCEFMTGSDSNGILNRNDVERRIVDVETRVRAYIIPNTPKCEDQVQAFCRAVYAQLEYECSDANVQMEEMPNGMKSFTVNGFSASFGSNGSGDMVSNAGLCRRARAELLLSGLLYRGVC